MIVGNPELFAIESEITNAYDRSSLMALGFFVVHVAGKRYGVKAWDATMLGNSFDEVSRRLASRRSHRPAFPMNADAAKIAHAFKRAIYGECEKDELFWGLSVRQFTALIASNRLDWTACCDEAFDDSSYLLQFEDQSQVRVVAFTGTPDFLYDPASLRDVCLPHDDFYGLLQEWHDRFNQEWSGMPKVSGTIQ